jgi:hypothetical protein
MVLKINKHLELQRVAMYHFSCTDGARGGPLNHESTIIEKGIKAWPAAFSPSYKSLPCLLPELEQIYLR